MKKGLRHAKLKRIFQNLGPNARPDEEGIKTKTFQSCTLDDVQTLDLMKKGLRPVKLVFYHPLRVQTLDLMKKGLRHREGDVRGCSGGPNARPDEEGIKTPVWDQTGNNIGVQTLDLMKKGLRQIFPRLF